MGKVTAITILTTVMALSFVLSNVNAGNTLSVPDKVITIEGKKPVKFKHDVHMELGVSCGECHHDEKHVPRTAEDISGLSAEDLKCATCHNSSFAVEKLQKAKAIFHANCKECHKKGAGGKKGPTKCSGCHVKKKAIEGR